MKYEVLEPSPIKRIVKVAVPKEEINAALAATVALRRRTTEIKGFRKGKVPSSIVESMFKKQIYEEAANDLINYHINDIMNELQLTPLSRIDVDAGDIVKDQPFEYSFNFEVAPVFELPSYEGLAVNLERAQASEPEIQLVLDRIRDNLAEFTTLEEDRPASGTDVVVVNFQAFENGEPLSDVKAENFQLALGQGQALPEFEAMIQGIKAGDSTESEITFPGDFLNEALAGKTVLMRITLKEIKEKKLPALDAEFAKKAGNFESVDKLREAIQKSYVESRAQVNKSAAQKKLLDSLTAQVNFPLPDSMVDEQIDRMIMELKGRLERMGKRLDALGKTPQEIRDEHRPQAESLVKSQLFLLAVATKENIQVSPMEIDDFFRDMAKKTNQDFHGLKHFHEQNNLMSAVKDRILADKAMEHIYRSAEITEIDPVAPEAREKQAQEEKDPASSE
ncbi:MAG TPA: trigger factor [Desulfonatronum sp.]|nr:trigger factor [Desulfonatronum sp.]